MKSSSSGKNLCKLPSHNYQSHHSPRKLTRTLSLRSTAEDRLFCNSPVEENVYNKYSDDFRSDKHNQNIDLPLQTDAISTPANYKREKVRSSSRQNLTSLSKDLKTSDSLSCYILPPLPQSSILETKCNNIPRPIHNVSRIPGQEIFNKRPWGTKNLHVDNYQPQPKHSSSLPSIAEGPKFLKYKGNMTSGNLPLNSTDSHGACTSASSTNSKKFSDKILNSSENSASYTPLIHKSAQHSESKSELKPLQHSCDGEECAKNNKIISSQHKDAQSSRTMNSTASSQSRSPKSGKLSLIPKSSSGLKQRKDTGTASVRESTDKDDGGTIQKRRISRFLRPDFYDTPPEESTYVKEREAKKAAEAEIKKAKRLARRTSSMRETLIAKTEIHDKNNSNTSEHSMSLIKNDSKTTNMFHKNSEVHLANKENHNEKIKPNPKISNCPLSRSDDNCNNSVQKRDFLRTSGSGLCSLAKSRVGKAISSLQEHNFAPWDKKIVATESTYLKRAVSVDDVSLKNQGSLTKSNPKLGRKISSVLGLFSKMDNPSLENQYLSNTLQTQNDEVARSYCDHTYSQNEVKKNSPSSNSLEKEKNKLEEKKQPFGTNFSIGEAECEIKNLKQQKSLKDSKNKVDLKKNNKKVAAQVISDALCNTKDPSKKTLNRNSSDLKSTNAVPQNIQDHKVAQELNNRFLPSNQSKLSDHNDETYNFSKSITDNEIPVPMVSSVVNENCEQPSIPTYEQNTLSLTNDSKCFSKVTNINSENSPVDETESVDSWCASSDIDAQENLGLPGDDDDKDSESVEDRIRRKSFYSRFNDVKKKGRKKSSQFLKDCRTLLPNNYHKNDSQAFLPQSSNTGAVSKKVSMPSHTTETHEVHGDVNNLSVSFLENSMPESIKSNELCILGEKEIRSSEKNRILDNVSNAEKEGPSSTCALLRPAAFAQSVLKKTSPVKGKTPTQPGNTSIPKLSDPVSGALNAVITSENTNQKEEKSTS